MGDRYLGATWIRLDSVRRITIPTCYGPIATAYLGVLTSKIGDLCYLIICNEEGKAQHQNATDYTFQVLGISTRRRLTLPNAACASFGLKPNGGVWLVGQGDHIELWSEDAWDREQMAAFEEYAGGRKDKAISRSNCEQEST